MKNILARTAATLAALVFAPIAARAQTSYTAIDLTPHGIRNTYAVAALNGTQVGEGIILPSEENHALLWRGTATSVVDLNPKGYNDSVAIDLFGNAQVGAGNLTGFSFGHALLWHGTAKSVVDLHPAGYDSSYASGIFGNVQVGGGVLKGDYKSHALLWYGTAKSVVDLHPANFLRSQAQAISGDTQVGYGELLVSQYYQQHALLWHGTAASAVDLNPAGYSETFAFGISGNTEAGEAFGTATGNQLHAVLWHGTAESIVDLNRAGARTSKALAVYGNTQVGGEESIYGAAHAIVWHGTAASAVDLNPFLPQGYNLISEASGISPDGDIVGFGYGSKGTHAFIWHPNTSAPLGIAALYPDIVTLGHADFTLTVNGTQFVPTTVVRWNGQMLATTYGSPIQVTARVPAALMTNSGTADITVQTPRVATSGAVTFHIRPLIGSLSPSTVNAGSAAFTFTVNGAGFMPDAIAVFDGVNLATHFVSSTQLTATVPAALVAVRGRKSVMVTLPHVATSRGVGFDVTP